MTQYFPPEVGATQTRLSEVSAELARRGHDVTVIAPFPHYPSGVVPREYRGALLKRDVLEGVDVVRTWVYGVPSKRAVKRLADYVSFGISSILGGLAAGSADVVFAETPPLFPALGGFAISRLKRCAYVCNVADLWLASAVALGVLDRPAVIRLGEVLERFVYRNAKTVIVVTDSILQALRAQGVSTAKLELIPNGVDTSLFRPDIDSALWRGRFGGDEAFVVLYAGNHGLAQDLDTVLDAARRLRGDTTVAFVLVGDGAGKERLRGKAAAWGLDNVAFYDPVPKSEMPRVLAAADACVVPLRDIELFRGAIPSKIFEAMAAARPLLLLVGGEAADLVGRAGAGICLSPGSAEELAEAVLRLAADPVLCSRLGSAGRAYVEAHHDRSSLVDRYEQILALATRP